MEIKINYLIVLCLLGGSACAAAEGCSVYRPGTCCEMNTEYIGININDGMETLTDYEGACQELCQATDGCNYFTWVDGGFPHSSWRNTCWLKSEIIGKKHLSQFHSGPKVCPPVIVTSTTTTARPGCHDYIFLGGPNLEFSDQYGFMKKQEDTSYKQLQGDHILKYQALHPWGPNGWTVIESETVDDRLAWSGGYEQPEVCVHEDTTTWEYFYNGEWFEATSSEDFGARASPSEQCSRDEMCAGCGMVVERDGHDWCCENQCDAGWIDFPGGECVCGH